MNEWTDFSASVSTHPLQISRRVSIKKSIDHIVFLWLIVELMIPIRDQIGFAASREQVHHETHQ